MNGIIAISGFACGGEYQHIFCVEFIVGEPWRAKSHADQEQAVLPVPIFERTTVRAASTKCRKHILSWLFSCANSYETEIDGTNVSFEHNERISCAVRERAD